MDLQRADIDEAALEFHRIHAASNKSRPASLAPSQRPKPFELILETPHTAPQYLQENALLAAMLSVLAEYRRFIAYGANL